MKRAGIVLLCLLMGLCLFGCGEKAVVDENGTTLFQQGTISDSVTIELKDEAGKVWLSNEHFVRVYAMQNEQNGYFIQLELTKTGTSLFAEATRENIGKTITVFADGETLVAAMVQEEIEDDSITITNYESKEALMDLFYKLARQAE